MSYLKEDNLFEEINLLRHEWLKEINVKKQNITDGKCDDNSSYRINLAHKIYISGQKAEMQGYLQIAVEQYRRATCLDNDIERKMKQDMQLKSNKVDQIDSHDTAGQEHAEIVDNETSETGTILQLPDEVLLHIMRWVVGAELDIYSLLLQGLVCSKFLSLSRDEQLWRSICSRLWPHCTALNYETSWISMVKTRPHLFFHGCYLGSTSYVRKGEATVNMITTPFLLVRYFRVLRFRSDGSAVMVTSAQEPQEIIRIIASIDRNRHIDHLACTNSTFGIATGYYSIDDNMVFVHLVRMLDKYGKSKKPISDDMDKHHLEMMFHIKSSHRRPNRALRWKSFSLRNDNSFTQFDTRGDKYPTLIFSRVREFCSVMSRDHL